MKNMHALVLAAGAALSLFGATSAFSAGDLATKFSNRGSIVNTRHNLTQRTTEAGPGGTLNNNVMDPSRNDYVEVCVYCHTPHGTSTGALPLWNRVVQSTSYITYNTLGTGTLTQTVTQPGVNSLSCLSCHDGQTAIDSIVNMPGSGRYNPAPNVGFLSTWQNPSGNNPGVHATLSETGCLACHSPGANPIIGGTATDFSVFAIGTDLRNDHPVGITFPLGQTGADQEFKAPTGTRGPITFFDSNTNGRLDKGDIRLYNTGDGPEVECASCHDPHGVPSAGAGSTFFPTFLRVSNQASAVCMTCHNK